MVMVRNRFREVAEAGVCFFLNGVWPAPKPEFLTVEESVEYYSGILGFVKEVEWPVFSEDGNQKFWKLEEFPDDQELLSAVIETAAIMEAAKKYNLNLSREIEERWKCKIATTSVEYFSGEGWHSFKEEIQDYKTDLFPPELRDFIQKVKDERRRKFMR